MPEYEWNKPEDIRSRSYVCGYCGTSLASEKGWSASMPETGNKSQRGFIYICHQCSKPTFIEHGGKQTPGAIFGNPVQDIPDIAIHELYDEARKTTSTGCYTAAVLCCRKLLMHIAVSKGAPVSQSFVTYVEFLADNHFVPPDAKDWVDHIRKKANEANHEIIIMKKEDAEDLLSFSEMLLKVIFEFPAAVKKKMASGGIPTPSSS